MDASELKKLTDYVFAILSSCTYCHLVLISLLIINSVALPAVHTVPDCHGLTFLRHLLPSNVQTMYS